MTRAAIYVRRPSERAEEGAFHCQLEDCIRLAELRGFDVIHVESDTDAAASHDTARPGFERIVAALENGDVKVVVAWRLDRLARNRRDASRLVEAARAHKSMLALVHDADIDLNTPDGERAADLFVSISRSEI